MNLSKKKVLELGSIPEKDGLECFTPPHMQAIFVARARGSDAQKQPDWLQLALALCEPGLVSWQPVIG